LQLTATGGAGATSASYTFSAGQWYHVAGTRDSSNNQRLFVNGALLATATSTNNYSQTGFTLGAGQASGNVNGYISNLRLVKGSALYTSAFTPSTTPLTAVSGTSLLTCQSNKFIDNSTNNIAITVTGDTKVQSQNPFQQNTGKSMYFDGTADRAFTESGPLNSLGAGDFTIEGWIYNSTLPSNARMLSQGSYTTGEYLFIIYSSGAADFTEATTARLSFPSGSFKTGQWQYFTIVRNGSGSNNLTAYINGVSVATATSSYNYNATTSTYIGSNPNTGSQDFNGYIKDLRITKGIARYTTTFTPPTTPDQTK
jgi:hypothetical protein